jgi:serine protease
MTWGGGAVQTNPAVYIVYWGWNGNDPAGEAAYQQSFFSSIGGTAWPASQTQYCENATALGTTCTAGPYAGNPSGVLKGTWADNTDPIPNSPTDADIQAEAVRAAAHFGNTTAASNASTQYVVDTPHGNSTSGFNTSWCAYHGMASSSFGGLSYTDFPYIPDAGANCGQNFVNSGSAGDLDGVSIVGGHEFAESVTDPDPGYGWTDTIGAETGDKCAWISFGPGAATDVSTGGGSFAVQSLWSNDDNSGAGGCVTYYASPADQH